MIAREEDDGFDGSRKFLGGVTTLLAIVLLSVATFNAVCAWLHDGDPKLLMRPMADYAATGAGLAVCAVMFAIVSAVLLFGGQDHLCKNCRERKTNRRGG